MLIFPSCARHIFDHCYVLSQPFTVFGTLAAAESQSYDVAPEKRTSRAAQKKTTSHVSRRRMNTETIGSILSLYRQLPRATYRLTKAVAINLIADHLMAIPEGNMMQAFSQQRGSKSIALWMALSSLACLGIAPLRLLSTETIVFKRFDWRSLQLNSKMLPIFVPNLVTNITRCAGSVVFSRLADRTCELITRFSRGQHLNHDRLGIEIGFLACATSMLVMLNVFSEILRIRNDLLVLNGDSEHSILPIDETYEGALQEGLGNSEHYSVIDACRRYLCIATLPSIIFIAMVKSATSYVTPWLPFIESTIDHLRSRYSI